MKTVERYICELCSCEYKTREDAEKCEKHHTRPIRVGLDIHYKPGINSEFHNTGIPYTVLVEMENGTLCKYLFNEVVERDIKR